MLIAISTYTKSLAEVDTHRQQHIDYMKSLLAADKILVAGRQNPPIGAVIIAKRCTREEFQQLLAEDPYVHANVASYNIIEFNPVLQHAECGTLFA